MEHVIDLDDLARQIVASSSTWRTRAQFSGLTWRDETSRWPQPIVSERSEVRVPESVGFEIERSPDTLKLVAWVGGWADADVFTDPEATSLLVEFTSVDEAMVHIDRIVDDFLADRPRSVPVEELGPQWHLATDDEAVELRNDLRVSLSTSHRLHGVEIEVVAVKKLRKDLVLWLPETREWAAVHLTGREEADPRLPSATVAQNWYRLVAEIAPERAHVTAQPREIGRRFLIGLGWVVLAIAVGIVILGQGLLRVAGG